MAGGKSNPPKARKRVEAETLKRARDGSAFTKCEACSKDVPVVLIDMHSCSLDSKIRQSLEAQVVEKVVETLKKPEKKRTAPSKEGVAKRSKKSNDSGKKRPPTAFFVFMEDFRKEYKEAHPDNKNVSQVAKEGGEKWKSLTEEEKKPYIEKAAQLKAEYEKAVEEDNNAEVAENEGEDANEEQNGEESNGDGSNEEQNGEDEKDSSDKEDDVVAVADKETGNED